MNKHMGSKTTPKMQEEKTAESMEFEVKDTTRTGI